MRHYDATFCVVNVCCITSCYNYNKIMAKKGQIFLMGVIDKWESEYFRYQIEQSNDKEIQLFISSEGGSVNAGFEIANYIEAVNAKGDKHITTHNLAHADSIATVVFLAPDDINDRHILESSTMFKHKPLFSYVLDVNEDEAEKIRVRLEIETNRVADYYVKKIKGLSKEEAISLMNEETTLTASKMKELKMVGTVEENFEIAAYSGTDIRKQLITNQINTKMGLFNKDKKVVHNSVSTSRGKTLLFEGTEIAVDSVIVNILGESLESFDGDYILTDNRTMKVVDNKVSELVDAAPASTEPLTAEQVVDLVAETVAPLFKEMKDELSNLKTTGSNHKPAKNNVSQEPNARVDPQKTAARDLKNLAKDAQNKIRENQGRETK